ncbi:Nramp family divalent metal transporter [Crocosphaera sp.]|uniref:Nramp family divalent metal transporter n=1 Tax=Crocosphaera sp. TaxID=2729996 RepID=UPI003F209E3B|nr:Nramp family divalent metal transporter [Crocosphaera sp.]
MLKRLKNLGPGLIIAAAFIGPGTITTASKAGASYGFILLWAIVFSTIATIILQEMSGRLGIVTRKGLGEALRQIKQPVLRLVAIILVIAAIFFGNTAFEMGNITGAAIGLEVATNISSQIWAGMIAIFAFLLLILGAYKLIEKVLILLVSLIGFAFLTTTIMVIITQPNHLFALFKGMIIPTLPEGSLLIVIALIGTTLVPYNLFLQANAVVEKWPESVATKQAVNESRFDTVISIALGGIITLGVASTSAAILGTQNANIDNIETMIKLLEPLLGNAAKYCFALGFFGAGLSSTLTAPLATAYAVSGTLGWKINFQNSRFRAIWIIVLVVGSILAITGKRPIESILFAQAANGLLLPFVATFLLLVMNSPSLGEFRNHKTANLLGFCVIFVAFSLGIFKILKVFAVL